MEKYGAAYASYRQSVPRWIPRRLAAPRALLAQSGSLLLLVPFATKLWWLAAWTGSTARRHGASRSSPAS